MLSSSTLAGATVKRVITPVQVNMAPEAIERLPGPESRLSSEALAAVCPGDLTGRKRETIHQNKTRVVLNGTREMLPCLLVDLSEVGCLAHEGGVDAPASIQERSADSAGGNPGTGRIAAGIRRGKG